MMFARPSAMTSFSVSSGFTTAKDRVERQRKTLVEAGGARVEAQLDASELAKLDALIATGVAGSRRAALKYLVQQLPEPPGKP